jgi:small subunit ribosomal protein S8
MQITDSIADMLTRIRNAGTAGHVDCEIPASGVKQAIAQILLEEGYITRVDSISDNKQGKIKITLKYVAKKPVISGLKRISKPGLRVYASKDDLPRVLGGLGIAVISTSKGIMTDRNARLAGVGGEVMAYIW